MGLGSIIKAATPVVSAIAPIIGGAASAFGQYQANQQTAASTQRQMDFQERMSNTSYQRGMKDMRLAGLNPILAYKQGGASTPGGASYQAQNVGSAGVASAAQVQQVVASTKLLNEQARREAALADRAEILNLPYTTASGALKTDRAKKAATRLKGGAEKLVKIGTTKESKKRWEDKKKSMKDPNFHNKYYGKNKRLKVEINPRQKGIY